LIVNAFVSVEVFLPTRLLEFNVSFLAERPPPLLKEKITQILIFLAVLNLEMLIRELMAFRTSMRVGVIL
jgi:hypothetical protein